MCRLIAKASLHATTILDEMLNCPTSLFYLSTQGRLPDNPKERGEHNDGCGLAYVQDKQIEVHKRSRHNAWDASYVEVVQQAKSNLFIAHNRLASAGLEPRIEGSHPFEWQAHGVPYCFSHNGTIYDFVPEAKEKNTSDSFLFLQYLISQEEKNTVEAIKNRLSALMRSAQYSSMIATLMSPDRLMVWRIYNDKKNEVQADYELYYTLYMKQANNSVTFASEPLDDGDWRLIPNKNFICVEKQAEQLIIHQSELS